MEKEILIESTSGPEVYTAAIIYGMFGRNARGPESILIDELIHHLTRGVETAKGRITSEDLGKIAKQFTGTTLFLPHRVVVPRVEASTPPATCAQTQGSGSTSLMLDISGYVDDQLLDLIRLKRGYHNSTALGHIGFDDGVDELQAAGIPDPREIFKIGIKALNRATGLGTINGLGFRLTKPTVDVSCGYLGAHASGEFCKPEGIISEKCIKWEAEGGNWFARRGSASGEYQLIPVDEPHHEPIKRIVSATLTFSGEIKSFVPSVEDPDLDDSNVEKVVDTRSVRLTRDKVDPPL